MDGSTGILWERRESLDVTVQRIQPPQSDEPVDAVDDSGSIEIRVSETGLVENVAILEKWRSHYTPDELGGAILAAYQAATTARLVSWSEAHVEALDDETIRARPAPPAHDSLAGQLQELMDIAGKQPDPAASMSALADLLREARDSIQKSMQVVKERALAEYVGTSSSRCVQATVGSTGALLTGSSDLRV
mgnify:FL=1